MNYFKQIVTSCENYDKCPNDTPCHKCIEEYNIRPRDSLFRLDSLIMIFCEFCGNKRCPHASNHNLCCTNSDDPGQEGSIYADI